MGSESTSVLDTNKNFHLVLRRILRFLTKLTLHFYFVGILESIWGNIIQRRQAYIQVGYVNVYEFFYFNFLMFDLGMKCFGFMITLWMYRLTKKKSKLTNFVLISFLCCVLIFWQSYPYIILISKISSLAGKDEYFLRLSNYLFQILYWGISTFLTMAIGVASTVYLVLKLLPEDFVQIEFV